MYVACIFGGEHFSNERGRERKNNKSVCSLTVKLSGKTKSINIFVYIRVGCTLYINSNGSNNNYITENTTYKNTAVEWLGKDLMGKYLFAFFTLGFFIHSTKIKCHTFELNCAQQKSVKLKLWENDGFLFIPHRGERAREKKYEINRPNAIFPLKQSYRTEWLNRTHCLQSI